MVNITINGIEYFAEENSTVLDAAVKNGVFIPTLCYLKEINEVGACRMCLIEVVGEKKLVAACKTTVREGMEIFTSSYRVNEARKVNLELIVSKHDNRCLSCSKNGNCTLQTLCRDYGIDQNAYINDVKTEKESSAPLVRIASKCIGCLRCVSVCEKQTVGVWDLIGTGHRARIDTKTGLAPEQSGCTLCGQCLKNCPVGALKARDDTPSVRKMLSEVGKKVLFLSPAVAEKTGYPIGKLVAAAKMLGFSFVYNAAAANKVFGKTETDLLQKNKLLISSGCYAAIRFVRNFFPVFSGSIAPTKSPLRQLVDAVRKEQGDVYAVAVLPCLSKKGEKDEYGDVDAVLGVEEFAKMLKSDVFMDKVAEKEFDAPYQEGEPCCKGSKPIEEFTIEKDGESYACVAVRGLENARKVLDDMKNGKVFYEYVKISADIVG